MLSAVSAIALAPTCAGAQRQFEQRPHQPVEQHQHFEHNHRGQWQQPDAQRLYPPHQPHQYQRQHAPRPLVAQQQMQLQRPPQVATGSMSGDQSRQQQLETALALSHLILMQRQQQAELSAAAGAGASDEPIGSDSEPSPNWSTSGELAQPAGDYLLRGESPVSGGVNEAPQWQSYGGEQAHQSGGMGGQLPAASRDYHQQHLFSMQQQPATTPTLNRQLLAPPSGGPAFYSAATTEDARVKPAHDDEPIRPTAGGSGNNNSNGNGNAPVHGRDSDGAAEQAGAGEHNANSSEAGSGKQQDNNDNSNGAIEQRGAVAAPEPRHRRRLFNRILKKAEWNTLFMELSKVFLRYFLDLALKDIIGKQSGAGVGGASSPADSSTTSRKKLDAQSELADLLKDFVKTAISNI